MIYLYNLEKTDKENIFIPKACHYMPFDKEHGIKDEEGNLKTKEELEKEGLLMNKEVKLSYEEDEDIFELFINMETKEHFYKCTGKVEEQPKSKEEIQEEKIKELEQAIAELSVQLSNLGGM